VFLDTPVFLDTLVLTLCGLAWAANRFGMVSRHPV